MAVNYEQLFGSPILNDQTYPIKEGLIRVWEVQNKEDVSSIDILSKYVSPIPVRNPTTKIGLFLSYIDRYFFFVLGNRVIKFRHDITPNFVKMYSRSNFDITKTEYPELIGRLLELGWIILHSRQIDNSMMKYHVKAKFDMTYAWFLVHPTKQIIIKITLSGSTFMNKLDSYWGYDIWRTSPRQYSDEKFGEWFESVKDYILMSGTIEHLSHSFQKEPDSNFADLLDKCPSEPLPFKELWCYYFTEYYSYPEDEIECWKTFPIEKLKEFVKDPISSRGEGQDYQRFDL